MKTLIIDLETLGIVQQAVILQITAGLVDSVTGETHMFNAKLDIAQQVSDGRVVDADTLRWWEGQSEEAKVLAYYPNKELDLAPSEALDALAEFLVLYGFNPKAGFVWQRGDRDSAWLTDLFLSNGWLMDKIPYKWWKVRDIRTAVDVLGHSTRPNGYPDNRDELQAQIPDYKQHDAVSDVKLEVLILKQCGVLGTA
jgi:hypothetical protein